MPRDMCKNIHPKEEMFDDPFFSNPVVDNWPNTAGALSSLEYFQASLQWALME